MYAQRRHGDITACWWQFTQPRPYGYIGASIDGNSGPDFNRRHRTVHEQRHCSPCGADIRHSDSVRQHDVMKDPGGEHVPTPRYGHR